jgi:ectoine hydroxylase-related dioxygenase (phytanoyl-CoA dioxygenase family)
MMQPIFKNKEFENNLDKYGYVILNNIIPDSKIDEISKFYDAETPNNAKQIFTTFFTDDYQYKTKVNQYLTKTLGAIIKPIFDENFIPFFGNFMVKPPFNENLLLHADWSYVDELNDRAINVWAPLVSTSRKNGRIWVIPKSHKIVNSIRGVNLPRDFYKNEVLLQTKYAKPLNIKKGQVLVYNARLLHFSYPNTTSIPRVALSVFFVPKNRSKYFYFLNSKTTKVEEYKLLNSEPLLKMKFGEKPPNLELNKEIPLNQIMPISKTDIKKYLKPVSYFNFLLNSYLYRKYTSNI